MKASQASRMDLMLYVSFRGMMAERVRSVAAWRETASWTPSSDAILGIKGDTPEVEIVIFDRLIPIPSGSQSILTALDTFRQLYNGSPWPINTTLSIFWPTRWRVRKYWLRISGVERFFWSFWVPVWQKVQEREQPTWLDKQIVFLLSSQIITAIKREIKAA